VDRGRRGIGTVPPLAPVPRDPGMELPLSFAQQRLWFLDQLEPDNPAYNIPTAMPLTGDVGPDLLGRVLTEVARRHEALRTTFASQAGRPAQVIAPPSAVGCAVIDLSGLPDPQRTARGLAAEEAHRPFDLRQGPLWRVSLVRLAARDHLLLATLHHIVSDGWSLGVLRREIAALYTAFAAGRPSPLPPLPVQYADFAVWQRSWLQGEVLQAEIDHWKNRLAGAPLVLELPADRPRPPLPTYRGAALPIVLPARLSAAVRELSRQSRVTPFMTLLAAWAVLLGRHAGQDDVLVGTPVAGRNRREIEDLIGFFINTLVLRTDLSGAPAFTGLLTRVREAALDAFTHQDLPFERLVEEIVVERDLAVSPLFQVMLNLQEGAGGQDRGAAGPVLTKFDLTLTLVNGPDGFAGTLEHSTDLFDSTTAARLLGRFVALLEGAIGSPGLSLRELPLLLPEELSQVLAAAHATAAPVPAGCLHELIAAQAAR